MTTKQEVRLPTLVVKLDRSTIHHGEWVNVTARLDMDHPYGYHTVNGCDPWDIYVEKDGDRKVTLYAYYLESEICTQVEEDRVAQPHTVSSPVQWNGHSKIQEDGATWENPPQSDSPLEPGTYRIVATFPGGLEGAADLVVLDSAYWQDHIAHPNRPPIADAGENQTIQPGDSADFNGTESHDDDGRIVEYCWTYDDPVQYQTETKGFCGDDDYLSVRYPLVGDYNVTLTVMDNDGASASDSIIIHVQDS